MYLLLTVFAYQSVHSLTTPKTLVAPAHNCVPLLLSNSSHTTKHAPVSPTATNHLLITVTLDAWTTVGVTAIPTPTTPLIDVSFNVPIILTTMPILMSAFSTAPLPTIMQIPMAGYALLDAQIGPTISMPTAGQAAALKIVQKERGEITQPIFV